MSEMDQECVDQLLREAGMEQLQMTTETDENKDVCGVVIVARGLMAKLAVRALERMKAEVGDGVNEILNTPVA